MHGSAVKRTRETTALAMLASIGGAIGLLAGLLLLSSALGIGGWGLVVALVVLVVALAELAFAYSAWTRTPWALKPGPRAAGFAAAIALILLGVAIVLTMPVRSTFAPAGSPITDAQ